VLLAWAGLAEAEIDQLLRGRPVPGPTVLLIEGDQFAVCRNPGGAAGLREEHQGRQPGHLAVLRHEVVTHGIGVGAGRQVVLVEDEEEDGGYAGDPCRKILGGRHPPAWPSARGSPLRGHRRRRSCSPSAAAPASAAARGGLLLRWEGAAWQTAFSSVKLGGNETDRPVGGYELGVLG
jgi:hypothetical protein